MSHHSNDSWYIFGGSSFFNRIVTSIFGSKASSRKTRKKSRRRSRKSRRSRRSDDSSSTVAEKKMTRQTKKLVAAIQDNVLPLLKTATKRFEEESVSKNRLLFALNRAAERALKRKDVFGHLDQLKAEAEDADKVVTEFLDKEIGRDSMKAQMSLIASKCALCGAACAKCDRTPPKKKSKRKTDSDEPVRRRSSVSWGEAEVLNFELSDGENAGAGYYPDPDSDSDEEEAETESKREEVAFDPDDFKKVKRSSTKSKSRSGKR